jgi:hypothetical protein
MNFIGVAQPLVRIMPSYDDSYGHIAIRLAEKAGLFLDQWQQDAVIDLLGINAQGRWTCREYAEWVPRQNGKGAILECRALAGLFLFDEKEIVWTAHEFKTSMKAFIRVRDLVRNLMKAGEVEESEVKIKSGNDVSFELMGTGQVIQFIARSKGSGRGFTGDCVFIDETFGYTKIQDSAVRPTMRARPNAQMVYTSTPPLDGASGEVMYKLATRAMSGRANRLGYRNWTAYDPTCLTLDDVGRREPGTGKLIIDLDDRTKWTLSNPAAGIRIDEEDMITDREAMDDVDFARECLGIWPREMGATGGDIDMASWLACLNEGSTRTGECAIAINISPRRESAAIALYGDGLDEKGHMQLVRFDYGTNWAIKSMVEIRDSVKPIAFSMSKATFASIETELLDNGFKLPEKEDGEIRYQHGDLLILDGTDTAAACAHMIEAVRDQTMLVRPDAKAPEILNRAVGGGQLKEGQDSVTWSRKDSKTDITPLVACTYARFAFITQKDRLYQEEQFFGAWR